MRSWRVGRPDDRRRAEVFGLLLGANAFWQELHVMFGVEASGEVVQIRQLHVPALDLPTFQKALAEFLLSLESWSAIVAASAATAADEPQRPISDLDLMRTAIRV